ncbi:MAG: tripartite tricarboxylate transporter substrate-binding protein [Rubrivivax sp.]
MIGQLDHLALPRQAGWDPIKDFAPVAMMTRAPQVLAIQPRLPFDGVAGLVAHAKKNPGRLTRVVGPWFDPAHGRRAEGPGRHRPAALPEGLSSRCGSQGRRCAARRC